MQFVLIMFTATMQPLGSPFIYRGVIAGPGEGAHMSNEPQCNKYFMFIYSGHTKTVIIIISSCCLLHDLPETE